jgi:hypothetical protein
MWRAYATAGLTCRQPAWSKSWSCVRRHTWSRVSAEDGPRPSGKRNVRRGVRMGYDSSLRRETALVMIANRIPSCFCNVLCDPDLSATALEPRICVGCVINSVCHAVVPVSISIREHTAKPILPYEPDLHCSPTMRTDTAVHATSTTCQSRKQTVAERSKHPPHCILPVSHRGGAYRGRYAAADKV